MRGLPMLYKNMANILHDRRQSYEVLHYTTVLGSYTMSKFDQYGNELIVGLQPTLDSDGKLCVLPEPFATKASHLPSRAPVAAFAEADTCTEACTNYRSASSEHTHGKHACPWQFLYRNRCDVHSRYARQTWVLLRLSERLCATSEAPHAISACSRASPVVLLS